MRHGYSIRTYAAVAAMFVLGQCAFAHNASTETGRWDGFAHQGGQLVAGAPVAMDLAPGTTGGPRALQGTISGLPAVQSTLNVAGMVTPSGILSLHVTTAGFTGTILGKVANLEGFTHDGDPSNIGDIDFSVNSAAGRSRGHLNMIHLYGGANWATASAPGLLGSAQGAALVAEHSTAVVGATTVSSQTGSELVGTTTIGENQYAMVGTVSDDGSLIMMGDGSVRGNGNQPPSIVGMLFAGGIALNLAGPAEAVGHFHQGFFGTLLPAVQRERPGAMSLNWGG